MPTSDMTRFGPDRFGRHQWHATLRHGVFRSWTSRPYVVTRCRRCGAPKSILQRLPNECPRNPLHVRSSDAR